MEKGGKKEEKKNKEKKRKQEKDEISKSEGLFGKTLSVEVGNQRWDQLRHCTRNKFGAYPLLIYVIFFFNHFVFSTPHSLEIIGQEDRILRTKM